VEFAVCCFVVLNLAFAHCVDAQDRGVAAQRLEGIRKTFPCVATHRIPTKIAGTISRSDACRFVALATNEIVLAHAEGIGVSRADGGSIESATVGQFRFTGLDGAPNRWYWYVTLHITGQVHDIEVEMDQLSPRVDVRRAEGGR
jgi:hypothetical protein